MVKGINMSFKNPLPRYVLWITRIIGYSVSVIAISIAWYIFGNMRLATHYVACLDKPRAHDGGTLTAMENAKALVACVDARSGIVEWLAFRPMKKLFSDLPSTPSNYVGTWLSRRGSTLYQITLDGNGQFFAKPSSGRDAGCVTGSWGVTGSGDIQKVVWLYDQGQSWPPDINPIEKTTPHGFVLVEKNGSRTEFTRTEHSIYADYYCASMQPGKSLLPKSEAAPVKQVENNNEYAHQTVVYAGHSTSYGQPSRFEKTGYVATTEDGKELLWRNYVDEGDMYCVPIQGGRTCFTKNKIASIREVSGRRNKDFDRWSPNAVIPKGWADERRSPVEEALDDYEEEYPEKTTNMPVPPDDDLSIVGAGKICRYAVLTMSIPVSTTKGKKEYYVNTAERTNIFPYTNNRGNQGHRFCFSTRSFAPDVKAGLSKSVLCTIYKVADIWKYNLRTTCDFSDDEKPAPVNYAEERAEKTCKNEVMHTRIDATTASGKMQTFSVKSAELVDTFKKGDNGYRFCYRVRGFAPGVNDELKRSVLCTTKNVQGTWQHVLQKDGCEFVEIRSEGGQKQRRRSSNSN